jgi:serine-type D-Ala-D-Ala carboxypeptidase/endopeptidase
MDGPNTAERRVSDATAQLLVAQIAAVGVTRTRVPIAPALLTRYSGRNELTPGFAFDIAADTGRSRLLIRLGDQARLPAYAASDRDFFFEAVDAQISFVADRTGRVMALLLHQGGRSQEARRLK